MSGDVMPLLSSKHRRALSFCLRMIDIVVCMTRTDHVTFNSQFSQPLRIFKHDIAACRKRLTIMMLPKTGTKILESINLRKTRRHNSLPSLNVDGKKSRPNYPHKVNLVVRTQRARSHIQRVRCFVIRVAMTQVTLQGTSRTQLKRPVLWRRG